MKKPLHGYHAGARHTKSKVSNGAGLSNLKRQTRDVYAVANSSKAGETAALHKQVDELQDALT